MGEGGSDVGEGKSERLLGVEIGTSGTSGVIARPDGEVVTTAEKDHAVRLPRPGWVEHDAEEDWWDGFVAVCSELLDQADGKVAALSISGIGPCLLAAGGDGRPLRPGILYGVDTRATKEVEELTDRYGNEEIMEVGGNPLTAQSVGPKILWLRRNEPEVWQETRYLLMAHTFIVHRLTGEYVLDHPSASMCDPIYDVGKYQWVESWAEDVAPGLELPALRWPSEVAGVVTKEAAEKTGLPAGVPVTTGTTDAFSEAVSVGVREPGDLMLMYGTTMATLEISEKALVTRSLWSTAGLFEETYALFAAMSTSGALTDWVRQICGGKSFEELTETARKVASGSEGLLVLPYFAGERTPVSDPKARGVICGLTLSHGQGHLYRAMLEATAFGVRHLFEAMGEAGGRKKRLVAVGGGTKGGLWTRIVSNTIGEVQELPEQNIGASYGDALLAGITSDLVEADADWSRIVETVEPDPSQQEVYDELYAVYRDLYTATRDQAHTLADLQHRQGEA